MKGQKGDLPGQNDNSITEKYCYNNDPANCQVFGGLYEWDEAMKYQSLSQGICPNGWHIATDEDYKNLEGVVDSQNDTLAGIWDSTGFRGFDAGLKLKSVSSWNSGGNGTDDYGFTAIPGGGAYGASATFTGGGSSAMLWTSDTDTTSSPVARYLDAIEDGVYRGGFQAVNAFSVRCVMD